MIIGPLIKIDDVFTADIGKEFDLSTLRGGQKAIVFSDIDNEGYYNSDIFIVPCYLQVVNGMHEEYDLKQKGVVLFELQDSTCNN